MRASCPELQRTDVDVNMIVIVVVVVVVVVVVLVCRRVRCLFVVCLLSSPFVVRCVCLLDSFELRCA